MTAPSLVRHGLTWPAARLPKRNKRRASNNARLLSFVRRVALFSSDPWLAREAAALHVELCKCSEVRP